MQPYRPPTPPPPSSNNGINFMGYTVGIVTLVLIIVPVVFLIGGFIMCCVIPLLVGATTPTPEVTP